AFVHSSARHASVTLEKPFEPCVLLHQLRLAIPPKAPRATSTKRLCAAGLMLFGSIATTFSAVSPATNVGLSMANNVATVSWNGASGVLYQAESATNLAGPWTPVDVPTTASAATNICVAPYAFYRVAIFTSTPAYLANFAANSNDKAAPSTPGNFIVNLTGDDQASLSWNPSS